MEEGRHEDRSVLIGLFLRDGDEDEVFFNLHGITGDFELGILRSLTGPDVIAPAMPRAFNRISSQSSFSQRSSGVRTGIIEGINRSINVEESHSDSIRLHP